jgi:fructan beta-fructosidase
MALAKGWKMGVEFYSSPDLKNWTHQSTFFMELAGRPSIQWECPDLIQIGNKWVLLVSVNPGGPILGSGTMYFIGDFDGKTFTADALNYPLWLDYGMDNYAGVTWSNTGDRKIMIGWMNNWQYAGNVPCSPWRSAMTLPRELKLIEYDGKSLLTNTVVSEIDKIAGSWQTAGTSLDVKDAYQLRITLQLDQKSTITLSNGSEEKYVLDVSASDRTVTAHRTSATGQTSFNGTFSVPSIQAPLNVSGNSVTLDIFVDQSSVEVFTENGSMSMTNLVFPQSIYNSLNISGAPYEAKVRQLNSIW